MNMNTVNTVFICVLSLLQQIHLMVYESMFLISQVIQKRQRLSRQKCSQL